MQALEKVRIADEFNQIEGGHLSGRGQNTIQDMEKDMRNCSATLVYVRYISHELAQLPVPLVDTRIILHGFLVTA